MSIYTISYEIQRTAPDYNDGMGVEYEWTNERLGYAYASVQAESVWGQQMMEIDGEYTDYAPYYGRGYTQLTGMGGYSDMSSNFFQDSNVLLDNPDLVAYDRHLSARITLRQMILGVGNAGGRSLSGIESRDDFNASRDILNPGDTQEHTQAISELAVSYTEFLNKHPEILQAMTESIGK